MRSFISSISTSIYKFSIFVPTLPHYQNFTHFDILHKNYDKNVPIHITQVLLRTKEHINLTHNNSTNDKKLPHT